MYMYAILLMNLGTHIALHFILFKFSYGRSPVIQLKMDVDSFEVNRLEH